MIRTIHCDYVIKIIWQIPKVIIESKCVNEIANFNPKILSAITYDKVSSTKKIKFRESDVTEIFKIYEEFYYNFLKKSI